MYRLLILFAGLFLPIACTDNVLPPGQQVCPDEVACTRELRSFSVTLLQENGKPYVLDDIEVSLPQEGIIISKDYSLTTWDWFRQNGIYPIVSDNNGKLFRGLKPKKVLFEGFVQNKKVVSAYYTFAHDCCHIQMIRGNTQISVR